MRKERKKKKTFPRIQFPKSLFKGFTHTHTHTIIKKYMIIKKKSEISQGMVSPQSFIESIFLHFRASIDSEGLLFAKKKTKLAKNFLKKEKKNKKKTT